MSRLKSWVDYQVWEIRRFLSDYWHAFWHNLIYKRKRVGNTYEKVINRFTGRHEVYKLHPLAMVGVGLSKEQADIVNELLRDERVVDAQRLILKEIHRSFDFDGIGEAFIKAANDLSNQDASNE